MNCKHENVKWLKKPRGITRDLSSKPILADRVCEDCGEYLEKTDWF